MTLPAAVANNRKDNNKGNSTFSNPIKLPPMETTYLPDRQKEEAFNSLEFSDNNGEEAVRCQCCNNWIHIVGRLQSPRGNRADTLRKRISYLQERYRKEHLHER